MTITRADLFDFDDVEQAIKNAIVAACSSPAVPVQVVKSSETPTNETPRVEIVFVPQKVQGQRFLLNPVYQNIQSQPFNTWLYELWITVVCNRETNGNRLKSIRGNARAAMEWNYLAPFIGPDVLPLHGLINIQDQVTFPSVEDIGNLDSSKLTFEGMVCIRNAAWSLVDQPDPPAISGAYLTPDSSQYYATPSGSQYYQQP